MYFEGGGGWPLLEIFEGENGEKKEGPQPAWAWGLGKRSKAKLVTAKLDRLSRNPGFIAALMDSGVEFVAVDNPHANKLTVFFGWGPRRGGG